ncbi:MAG: phasin family protein [Curvibacter sp.]|nr:phasin family protein [Curvibacter sp.]
MAKPPLPAPPRNDAPPLAEAIRDSAQSIWLAGLGAFAKAQEEGEKVFDALVQQGQALQQRTQMFTGGALHQDPPAPSASGAPVQPTAGRPAGPWDRLENIFDERVARSLSRLEVPTALELHALVRRIDALEHHIRTHTGSSPAGAPDPSRRRKPAAKVSKPVRNKDDGTR